MRQDMRERQRQIRRLHQSIQKYEQSPRTKQILYQASIDLINAIEYKYKKSQINKNYIFPRTQQQQDEYDKQIQIINLKIQTSQLISQELSIAQEAQSNHVYISQKTILIQNKYLSSFHQQLNENKNKLKIKIIKKNNFQSCQSNHKLDRLRTQQIHFSTNNFKKQPQTSTLRLQINDNNRIKSRIFQQNTQCTGIRKKLKIASKVDHHDQKSTKTSLTIKTQYTYSNKRKQGKQNLRPPIQCRDGSNLQKHLISQNNIKKMIQPLSSSSKAYLNLKCSLKKPKQNDISVSFLQTQKSSKIAHKSSENLKSIRLGRNSTEKLKTVKLYA